MMDCALEMKGWVHGGTEIGNENEIEEEVEVEEDDDEEWGI